MLGFSPTIMGNPWLRCWSYSNKPFTYQGNQKSASQFRNTYDLGTDIDSNLLLKYAPKTLKSILIRSKSLPRRLATKLHSTQVLRLEELPKLGTCVLRTKKLKLYIGNIPKKSVEIWLKHFFTINKDIEWLHVKYDRPEIEDRFPFKLLRKLKKLKSFYVESDGEYLCDLSDKLLDFRRHCSFQNLSLGIKNFYFRHTFNKPLSLKKYLASLPKITSLKQLNIDCYDQNVLNLSSEVFKGLYNLFENHQNKDLNFDIRLFMKGALPKEGCESMLSKIDYLALCTNHLLSERTHLDATERLALQRKYKRKLMLNYCSGQDIQTLEWIKSCHSLKALDIHFSNMVGEESFKTAFEYVPKPDALEDLILDFERTPPILANILKELSISLAKMKALSRVGLFITNITKSEDVYEGFEDLAASLSHIKDLALLIFDTDRKPIELDKFGSFMRPLRALKSLRFELSLANFDNNSQHIESILKYAGGVESLEIDFDLRTNVTIAVSLPLSSLTNLKHLSVSQRFFLEKWAIGGLAKELKHLESLESLTFSEPQYGMELADVYVFLEKLHIPEMLKRINLCFPIYVTSGWDKNKLDRDQFRTLRKKLKSYLDKYSMLESIELKTPGVEGLNESIISVRKDISIEKIE